jgi:hypothetical protein
MYCVTCLFKGGEILLGDAALGRLQAASFSKYRPTVREDMMYHPVCRFRGRSSSGNSSCSILIILG